MHQSEKITTDEKYCTAAVNMQNRQAPFFQSPKIISSFVENGDSEASQQVPTTTVTAAPAATSPCSPVGVTYDEFLKQTGNIDDSFGITTLSSADVVMPEVVLNKGVLQKTSASFQANSFFLKAQTFKDKGIVILQDDGDATNNYCPKGRYERHWLVTASGADKIKEGEQEHCDDFTLAFNLTLAKYRDAVNSAAGKSFASEKKAKTFLEKKTGVHPDKWAGVFWCLASKTKDRDKMNWHLPKYINPRINKACDKAVVTLSTANLPEIGKHKPDEIIKDCGEAGKQ